MTCDFMSFSTIFQSNQDDEPVIMKGYVQLSPVSNEKTSTYNAGLEPVRSVGQR